MVLLFPHGSDAFTILCKRQGKGQRKDTKLHIYIFFFSSSSLGISFAPESLRKKIQV